MQGIYIHIPFCRQACRYCDFYFTVSLQHRKEFTEKLIREIRLRKNEYIGEVQHTLYLGGGTPSVLFTDDLRKIVETVFDCFSLARDAEISIECNPDDMSSPYLGYLRKLGFNRISIGIQSFNDIDLKLMRRSHDADQAERAVSDAKSAGFDNISIDLMYGIPGQTQAGWEGNIKQALSLPINHLSAYHLSIEPGTVFDHWRKKGRLIPVHENQSIGQYKTLREMMIKDGFDHYEISNFAREGKKSAHNMVYWTGVSYVGFGPSAHSYNGSSRSWNVASVKNYMEKIECPKEFAESEDLAVREKYHDYLITSLRTKWGADPELILQRFGEPFGSHFKLKSAKFIKEGTMWKRKGKVAIHPDHWLLSDHLLREMFTSD